MRYPAEIHEFFLNNYKDYTQSELALLINQRFGTEFTKEKVDSYFGNHHLRVVKRERVVSKLFPEEVQEYIRAHVKGIKFSELTEAVNSEFGTNYTLNQIKYFCKNRRLRNGVDCRLKAGNIPFTKGKKWDEFMSPEAQAKSRNTCFKKGMQPHNTNKVGDICITTDGYLVIKVQEHGTQLERWTFVHRLVYEENFGPIPDNCVVIFKDGDKLNCNPDNLLMVTRTEHAILNTRRLRSTNPEITQARVTIMRIQKKVRELHKLREKKENGIPEQA